MKVILLEKTTFRGKKLKKGQEIDLPYSLAMRMCAMSLAKKA